MTSDAPAGADLRQQNQASDLRRDYETSSLTRKELAEKYHTDIKTINARRVAEQWTPRESGPIALQIYRARRMVQKLEAELLIDPSANPSTAAKPAATASGGTPPHRRLLIRRLYDVVDGKLGEIETRIMTKTKLTGTDADRETRDVGALIKTFEKLIELSDAPIKPAAKSTATSAVTNSAAADDTADDTERLRQDLVERFARLRQHTDAGPTSVQPVAS